MDDEEREFWARAALRAHRAIIMSQLDHHKKGASAPGAAHLAAEYADALLVEFRRRFRNKAP